MEKQIAFHVLGLKETKDEREIQDAYRGLLKGTNPEDDPEGFKRLREAYETALSWARRPKEEEKEKTEIDRWIDRVNEIYLDIHERCSPKRWMEVLEDPICTDLDTSLQVREAMMAYLMDHIYLPNVIWKLLDECFQIAEDRESLEQQFPADFLNYVIYYIHNTEFINYYLFDILDRENMNADAYIRNFLGVKRMIDQGQANLEECRQKLEELQAFGIYHPYEDVEMLRILYSLMEQARPELPENMTLEETAGGKEAVRLTRELLEKYESDNYVLLHCGMVKWTLGQKEEAMELWEKILKNQPAHYMAKFYTIRYLMEKKEYKQAKERMLELLDIDPNDEQVIQYLHTANEALIEEYENRLKQADYDQARRFDDTMELARCFYQNDKPEDAVPLLDALEPDKEQEYDYSNLFGRVLYRADEYERACPRLKRWLELIRQTPREHEDYEKRKSREFRACHILSGCCHEMGDREQAMDYVEQAIKVADNQEDRVSAMQYKAYMLFTHGEYENCVDACDQVIRINERYFTAYLQRQEAAFKLKRGQQVVDDYYHAINIYNGYYKPYLLAAETFFYHDQYEDAKGVLERARENGIEFTDNMKLYEVKVLRNLAEKREDREKPFAIILELLETVKSPETDIEDVSEIEYEIALLHWDNGDLDDAVKHLEHAIEQNPDRNQYHMVGGHIYLDKKAYKRALEEYGLAREDYGESPALHYNCGLCQEGLGLKALAVECYKKALEYKEGYRDACEKIADYYKDRYTSQYDKADYEMALSYMNRQLAVKESCYYLVERGRIYMSAYKLEEAIKDFEKALEYVPNDWASYNNMGCCYKYMGQFEKGIECLQKAVECMSDDKSVLPYSNMADCYEAMGQYQMAIDCYLKDLEMFPDRRVFRKEIGNLYLAMDDYENALKYYEMEPDLDDYYENVATVYYLQGKEKLAIKTYEEGIRKASKEDKSDRFNDLAYFYNKILADYKKAEYYYKKALAAATSDGSKHELEWKMAALYFGMGKKDNAKMFAGRALEHFQKAGYGTEENYLNYKQYRPARLMRFGWIYICLGETEKGLNMFREMNQCIRCRQCRYAGCFEAYQYMARYYEIVGDYEKALELYEKACEISHRDLVSELGMKRMKKKLGRR